MILPHLILTGFLATSCLAVGQVPAASPPETESSRVSDVTLYRDQAMVTRRIQTDRMAGNHEIVISDLPENVVADSLFAEGSGQIEIRAVQYRARAVGESPREEVRALQDELTLLQDQLELNQKNIEIADNKARYLDQLEKTVAPQESTDATMEATDLERMTVFLFEQRELIAPRQIELNREQRGLKDQITLLQRQLREITNGSTKTVREAVLFVSKADDSPQEIRLNYLVNQCGWSPTYTIRSNADHTIARLDYNGLIYQLSGEDWKDVSLTLSTASPALSAAGPGLAPLRVTLVASDQNALTFQNLTKGQIEEIVTKQQVALMGNRNATNYRDFNESSWSINEAADQLACVEIVGDAGAVNSLGEELDACPENPA